MGLQTATIGLGSNLGNPEQHCRMASDRLAEHPNIRVLARSSLYRTLPVDAPGPDYCNGILQIETDLSALGLLEHLLRIEQEFGRTRIAWHAPRTLDLDLITYGDLRISSSQLTLPHPRAHERAFVLVPLCELDPDVLLGPAESKGLTAAGAWLARLGGEQRGSCHLW